MKKDTPVAGYAGGVFAKRSYTPNPKDGWAYTGVGGNVAKVSEGSRAAI